MLFERKMIYEISTGVYNAGYIITRRETKCFRAGSQFSTLPLSFFSRYKKELLSSRELTLGKVYIYIPLFSYTYYISFFIYSFIFLRVIVYASCERFFLAIPAWRLIVLHLTKKKKKIAYIYIYIVRPTNTVTNTETRKIRKIHKKKYASRWKRKRTKEKKKLSAKKAFASSLIENPRPSRRPFPREGAWSVFNSDPCSFEFRV